MNPLIGRAFFFTGGTARQHHKKRFAKNESFPAGFGAVEHLGFSTDEVGKPRFPEANRRVQSSGHAAHAQAVKEALEAIGLKHPVDFRMYHGVGDWAPPGDDPGAENSVMHVINRPLGESAHRYLASKIGLAANQLAVLTFRPDNNGPGKMHRFFVPEPTTTQTIRDLLDANQVHYRTIVKHKGGHTVFVAETKADHETNTAIRSIAHMIGDGNVDQTHGHAEFVGDNTSRSHARRAYSGHIAAHEGRSRPAGS